MSIEPPADPSPERPTFDATQPDLFGAPAAANPWTQPDWRQPTRQQVFAAGLVIVPILAAGLGYLASPKLDTHAPMQPVAGTPMQIVVGTAPGGPSAAPVAAPGAPLQTLPPDMARAAAANAQAAGIGSTTPQAQNGAAITPVSLPARQPTASFTCDGALSQAEAMVCGDPGLAAADRRMQRSWRRALESGADPDDLRHDQRDWLRARDEAAADGPQAVAALYNQRIQDLDEETSDDYGQH